MLSLTHDMQESQLAQAEFELEHMKSSYGSEESNVCKYKVTLHNIT